MPASFVWNVDPVFARLRPITLRYYGICFAFALLTAFAIWYHRVRRFGESEEFAEEWLWWGVPAVLIGGRLGFCLFYRPDVYLANPLRIFALWEGGIASHGVALGVAVALWLFARRHHVTFTRLGDYIAPAAALAVGWVRVGNFFNSEIVGLPASVPWAVVFARYDMVPRHPAQLYDMLIGQRKHQSQGVGREVRGASPQPGGARALEFQMRTRRAHLLGGRGDRRALRHPVLLLQGHRREQPTGAIRLRVETIGYFLRRHRERLVDRAKRVAEVDRQIARMRSELRTAAVGRGVAEDVGYVVSV